MMRTLAILFAVLSILIVTTGAAFAGTQNPGACDGDTSTILLHENGAGDTGDGNDAYWVCSQKAALELVNHTLPGDCSAGILGGSGDWNDCVSSWTIKIPSGWRACFYRGHDFTYLFKSYAGPITNIRYTMAGTENDVLSSVKMTTGSC